MENNEIKELSTEVILSAGIILMQYVGVEFENNTFGVNGADGKTHVRASIPKDSTMESMDDMLKGLEPIFGEVYSFIPRTREDFAQIIKRTVIAALDYDSVFGITTTEEDLKDSMRFFIKVREQIWTQKDAHDFYKKLQHDVAEVEKKYKEYEEV